MTKKYEVYKCLECSDGFYYPLDTPEFVGTKFEVDVFVENYNETKFDDFAPLEVHEVTYKKGVVTKRTVY